MNDGGLGGPWTQKPESGQLPWFVEFGCTAEELISLMKAGQVDGAVLVTAYSAYQYDNSYAADSAQAYPALFSSVGMVDVSDGPAAAADLSRWTETRGVRGIRWWGIDGSPLDAPAEVWAAIDRLRIPVVVAVLPDRLDELARVAPTLPVNTPILLDHTGDVDFSSGVPLELSQLVHCNNVSIKVTTRSLNAMAEHGDPADCLAELASAFGGDRLMWGSNYSFNHELSYPELAEFGRRCAAKLTRADRSAFLGTTALSLWPSIAPS